MSELTCNAKHLEPGRHRMACPKCRQEKRRDGDDAFEIVVHSDGYFRWRCYRCDWNGWHVIGQSDRSTRRQSKRWQAERRPLQSARPKAPTGLSTTARQIWEAAKPISNCVAAVRYLAHRKCPVPPDLGDLRAYDSFRHPSGLRTPALIGLVTHAVSGTRLTLHQTFLASNGSGKASINRPRLLFPKLPKREGVIRLWPDDCMNCGLAVAEGVETALTLARVFGHAWATIDAGNLANLPIVPGIEVVTVAVDHDVAGITAYKKLAERWHAAGVTVRSVLSPMPGEDLNDLARRCR